MAKIKIPSKKISAYIKKKFEYKERKDGEELIICNPLNGDSGFHFNINLEKGVCHDWRGDGWAGKPNPLSGKRPCNIIRFVSLYERCTTAEAIKILLDGAVLEQEEQKKEHTYYDVTLPTNKPLSTSNGAMACILINWLKSRAYTDVEIAKYDLRCFGSDVIWPYYEFESLVYWQSRSYLNKTFRFPSPNIYDKNGDVVGKIDASKGQFLYGFDDIEINGYIIITEAIFDKNALGDQAVASGGASLTHEQLIKIRLLNPKKGIILAPDQDKAGLESIIHNYNMLKTLGLPIYYSVPDIIKNDKKSDWNDLFQVHKLSKLEIRKMFDKNIKPLNVIGITKLYETIKSVNRMNAKNDKVV